MVLLQADPGPKVNCSSSIQSRSVCPSISDSTGYSFTARPGLPLLALPEPVNSVGAKADFATCRFALLGLAVCWSLPQAYRRGLQRIGRSDDFVQPALTIQSENEP